MRGDMAGDEMGRPARLMAHHKHVHMHGLDVADGVEQTLALRCGRRGNVYIQHVSRQALRRQFKCVARPGAIFKKQVDDGFAAQQWHLFDLLLGHAGKRLGNIHDAHQQVTAQPVDSQEMAQPPGCVELDGFVHGSLPRFRSILYSMPTDRDRTT